MALQTYTFGQLVSNIATAIQASADAALNFTPGSALRAISEAVAGVVLWLQAIILQLLTLTRASTSQGPDLDSWMADYSLARLPANFATGLVTFSRFTPALQAVVPVGATVQAADGGQRFAVTVDIENPAYSPTLGGYVLAANTSSLAVPVRALAPGAGGNVLSGSIAVLSTPIPGVDTVSNASAFINGVDAESDAAFRARFVLFLASLSRATKTAVRYAVTSLQQGVVAIILENEQYDGTDDDGFFAVVVDDGSGDPPDSLLTAAYEAVDLVRPLGSRFGIYPPEVLTANVGMTLTSAPGYTHAAVVAGAVAALQNFINRLPLGTGLPYTQLANVAYGVPGVVNASAILLNGATADLAADAKQKLLAGTVAVA